MSESVVRWSLFAKPFFANCGRETFDAKRRLAND
jgi:hypothetical protein